MTFDDFPEEIVRWLKPSSLYRLETNNTVKRKLLL